MATTTAAAVTVGIRAVTWTTGAAVDALGLALGLAAAATCCPRALLSVGQPGQSRCLPLMTALSETSLLNMEGAERHYRHYCYSRMLLLLVVF